MRGGKSDCTLPKPIRSTRYCSPLLHETKNASRRSTHIAQQGTPKATKLKFGLDAVRPSTIHTALSRQLYHFCLCFVYPRRWLVWVLGLGGVSLGISWLCWSCVCARACCDRQTVGKTCLPDEHDLFGSFRLRVPGSLILARHHTTPHNEGREPGASPQLCCGRKDARSTKFLWPLWVFSQNVA